jgi:hypothetical protein
MHCDRDKRTYPQKPEHDDYRTKTANTEQVKHSQECQS